MKTISFEIGGSILFLGDTNIIRLILKFDKKVLLLHFQRVALVVQRIE